MCLLSAPPMLAERHRHTLMRGRRSSRCGAGQSGPSPARSRPHSAPTHQVLPVEKASTSKPELCEADCHGAPTLGGLRAHGRPSTAQVPHARAWLCVYSSDRSTRSLTRDPCHVGQPSFRNEGHTNLVDTVAATSEFGQNVVGLCRPELPELGRIRARSSRNPSNLAESEQTLAQSGPNVAELGPISTGVGAHLTEIEKTYCP